MKQKRKIAVIIWYNKQTTNITYHGFFLISFISVSSPKATYTQLLVTSPLLHDKSIPLSSFSYICLYSPSHILCFIWITHISNPVPIPCIVIPSSYPQPCIPPSVSNLISLAIPHIPTSNTLICIPSPSSNPNHYHPILSHYPSIPFLAFTYTSISYRVLPPLLLFQSPTFILSVVALHVSPTLYHYPLSYFHPLYLSNTLYPYPIPLSPQKDASLYPSPLSDYSYPFPYPNFICT